MFAEIRIGWRLGVNVVNWGVIRGGGNFLHRGLDAYTARSWDTRGRETTIRVDQLANARNSEELICV